ncbi:MAG: phosphopantothenoylcysteine decarboxylase, partial [Acidimicrobiales bacterium]
LAEPAEILAAAEAAVAQYTPHSLDGLRVLVTAGGTREPLDAVRFLGNRSSGKQGHALAEAAAARGAAVTLVTTTALPVPAGVAVVRVETAAEMERAVLEAAGTADVVVMAAAVADFRPKAPAGHKLKKADGVPDVVLEPTTDILAALGRAKRPGQVLVGFAAETSDAELVAAATEKLRAKHLDLVVANDVSAPDAGFDADTNRVVLVTADGSEQTVPLSDKRAVARAVLDAVAHLARRPA